MTQALLLLTVLGMAGYTSIGRRTVTLSRMLALTTGSSRL